MGGVGLGYRFLYQPIRYLLSSQVSHTPILPHNTETATRGEVAGRITNLGTEKHDRMADEKGYGKNIKREM